MMRSNYNFGVLDIQRHKYEIAKQAGATTEELTARYVMLLQAEDAVYNDPLAGALESKTGQICILVLWGLLFLIRIFPDVICRSELHTPTIAPELPKK